MGKKKINLNRHRDLDQLFTVTYEFIKQNLFQYTKLILIGILPFVIWTGVLGFDLLIPKGFNIFSTFETLKTNTTNISSLTIASNLFTFILYGVLSVLSCTLVFYYVKLFQKRSTNTKLNLANIWTEIKESNPVVTLLNTSISLLVYLLFLILMATAIFITYRLVLLGLNFVGSAEVVQRSAKILTGIGLFIFTFAIALPSLLYILRIFMRFSLFALYSVPFKLVDPNLGFSQFLEKCNQLVEGYVIKYWFFIHLIGIALLYLAYISSIPVYGLFLKMGIFELPIWGAILNMAFKCFSYGFVIFIQGLTVMAISISFYSLYAKLNDTAKQKNFTQGPLGYQISKNGA